MDNSDYSIAASAELIDEVRKMQADYLYLIAGGIGVCLKMTGYDVDYDTNTEKCCADIINHIDKVSDNYYEKLGLLAQITFSLFLTVKNAADEMSIWPVTPDMIISIAEEIIQNHYDEIGDKVEN